MRTNLPVSNIEYPVPEGEVLVSKTDLKGVITYCNKAFLEVSGYPAGEMLGQSHNIVRHPDVPQQLFADVWATIKSGRSWHGVIKNRRSNGDYYWVDANITPLLEDGEQVGYVSLRYKPSAKQIVTAGKYFASMRDGKSLETFSHDPDKSYVGDLQQRFAEKIVAQENYLDRLDHEQRIAAGYMNKLIALDKLNDPAVQFFLKPAENFSGDLLALSRTPDGRLHLMLADSTGHGLPAALAAMPMIHPFYSMTSKGFSIAVIAKEINAKVKQSLPTSHFVAAILVSIDPLGQMVEVWSGGCPPPLVLNNEGVCAHQFKARHLAMGILPPEQFDSSVEYFSYDEKDCSVLMFSDGAIELENDRGEQFGLDRMLSAVQATDADNRLKNIYKAIETHCGNRNCGNDDIALMIAQCESREKLSERESLPERRFEDRHQGNIVWQFTLTLDMSQIKQLDVVPMLLDIVQQIERDKGRGGEIFMVLSEMFNNALDHGLLKLDSSLKHHEDGMEKYFDERAIRLARADKGQIRLNLEKELSANGNALLRIRVKDSGDGFNYEQIAAKVANDTQRHGRGFALLYSVCSKIQFMGNGSGLLVELNLTSE